MKEYNITQSIISTIKEKKIKPKARWEFVFKNYFLWFIGSLSLLFGALSFSLFIYIFNSSSFVFYQSLSGSIWELVFTSIPFFWLLFLILFLYLSYLNFKRTKKAYKYSPVLIISLAVFFSIALAYFFHSLGLNKQLDLFIGRNTNLAIYSNIINPQMAFWSEPSQGRLSGLLIFSEASNQFVLIDKNEDEWIIDYSEAMFKNITFLEEGLFVKSFGEQISSNQFKSSLIMPMNSGHGAFNRNRMKKNINNLCPGNTSCHKR